MNLRHPFEQLIAEKLRQLPAPDADTSWLQMKRLLDVDEDTGGGGRKRPPGNNGWWRLSILAIIVSTSFWLYIAQKPTPALSTNKAAVTEQPATNASETNNSHKAQTATIDKTTTLIGSNTSTKAADNKKTDDATAGKSVTASATKKDANAIIEKKLPDNAADPNILINSNQVSTSTIEKRLASAPLSTGKNKTTSNKYINGNTTKDNATVASSAGNEDVAVTMSASGQHSRAIKHGTGKSTDNGIWDDNTIVPENNSKKTGNNYAPANQSLSAKDKSWFERLTELKVAVPSPTINTSLSAGDNMENTRNISNLLTNETKKLVVKAQRDKAIALLDKKDKKSLHLDLSNLFKPFSLHIDNDPWWAAGIALNSPITVGAQNRYNYNVNAKSNTLTDYIPSPYLQFHLNNYVYFQTELNFSTPQYTPQLLVYRQNNALTAQSGSAMSQQKSVYIQKMYYFNWPVSLHYSPVSNLYFSGGLQFSSFQSGLASIEERQYSTASGPDHASSVTSNILKFKDDSIAAKIAPNEWRWQLGAEYYWNRFSVGLRYNQSFKNAINTNASAVLPSTISRNQSLLFFVRYNLFESRQKESSSLKNQ